MRTSNGQYLRGIVDMFEQSGDMHMITNRAGVIEYVNPAFESVTGFGKAEAIGLTPVILESGLHPNDSYAAMWDTLKAGKAFKGVLVNRKRNGEIFHEETTISPIRDALGNITHFFVTGRDVTLNVRELDQLQRLANFDSLTGLPNRNLFMDRLQQALSHTVRKKQQVALIFLDMDGFKQINDSYGHATGDELLQVVASRLKSCVRQEDTVARLCGDEFVIILSNTNGNHSVVKVLNKIICSFKKSPLLEELDMTASCSIGVSIYPRDGKGVSELLKCADIAMYRTKAEGGNGYCFYSEQNDSDASTATARGRALEQPDILSKKIREKIQNFQGRGMPAPCSVA